jgi:hypothetical protein
MLCSRELIISSPGGIFDAFIDEVATSLTASGRLAKAGPAWISGRSRQNMKLSSWTERFGPLRR